jgi:hypothetical protein
MGAGAALIPEVSSGLSLTDVAHRLTLPIADSRTLTRKPRFSFEQLCAGVTILPQTPVEKANNEPTKTKFESRQHQPGP